MKHNVRKAKLGKKLENPRMEARARKLRVGNLVRLAPSVMEFPVGEMVGSGVGVVTSVRPINWSLLAAFTATTYLGRKLYLTFGFYIGDLELVKR